MENVQQGKSAIWKNSNMKRVQNEKSATRKSATWKKSKYSSIQISIGRVLAKY